MDKFEDYEGSSNGVVSFENIPEDFQEVKVRHLGIQIKDGRVWICIDGMACIRMNPVSKYHERMLNG